MNRRILLLFPSSFLVVFLLGTAGPAGQETKKPAPTPADKVESFSQPRGNRAFGGAPVAEPGYYYESFVYEWIDTSVVAGGTVVDPMENADDAYVEDFPIGFDFPFYGIDQSTVNISSNGFLSFYAPSCTTEFCYWQNDQIPTAAQPNGIVAPFWDDLNPDTGGEVTARTVGFEPNRTFTVTWSGLPQFPAIGAVTFQASLYESTGDIVFRYQDVLFEDVAYDNGFSATIGVENGRGSAASVFAVNTVSVSDGDALRFYPVETNQAYDLTPEIAQPVDTTTGDSYMLGDDDSLTIPVGFDFPFFGASYDLVRVGSNGYLTFGGNPFEYNSQLLPDPAPGLNGLGPVNSVIAPFWDDLNPIGGGAVRSILEGAAPDRRLTVSWEDVPHFPSSDGISVQATLHENGDVLFTYEDVQFGDPAWDNGSIASVGLEDAYGNTSARYSFRQPVLNDGLALRFTAAVTRQVGAGGGSSFSVTEGGLVIGWGVDPELGDGIMTGSRATARYVVNAVGSPIEGIVALAGGGLFDHVLALRRDGTILSWGKNLFGQLGDGTTVSLRDHAAEVLASERFVGVAAGGNHSLALNADGTVYSWGWNVAGVLGDGTTSGRSLPGLVVQAGGEPLQDVVRIAAGDLHSLALLTDGSLRAWGANFDGQLGNGTTTDNFNPVTVTDSLGTPICCAIDVMAGKNHSLALLDDGSVLAWGRNLYGQLGDNSNTNRLNPITVQDEFGAALVATAVFSGAASDHSLAVRIDGVAVAWGRNDSNQLGDQLPDNRAFAAPVIDLDEPDNWLRNVSWMAAGQEHNIVRQVDNSLKVWGNNDFGQLGCNPSFDFVCVPFGTNNARRVRPFGLGLSITQTVAAEPAVGVPFNVMMTLQNEGPLDSLGTQVALTHPPELELNTLPAACIATNQTIRCLAGLLRNNENSQFTVGFIAQELGFFQTDAEITASPYGGFDWSDLVLSSYDSAVTVVGASDEGCEPDNSFEQARTWPDETDLLCPTGHFFFPVGDVDNIRLYLDGKVCEPTNRDCVACVEENNGEHPDCSDLQTRPFPTQVTFDAIPLDPNLPSGELVLTATDANGDPLTAPSPNPPQPPTQQCDSAFGDLFENCIEFFALYDGEIVIRVESGAALAGWNGPTSIVRDTDGPADEIYLDPIANIDPDAWAALGLGVPYVRMNACDLGGCVEEVGAVEFGQIFGIDTDYPLTFALELWTTNPAGKTCIEEPALCIFVTDEIQSETFGWSWNWEDTCCYATVEMSVPDADEDGIPDAIDPDLIPNHDGDEFVDSLDNDDDGDGIDDSLDKCPLVPDPEQPDIDGDGIGDACDGTMEIALCSNTVATIEGTTTQDLVSAIPDAIENLRVQLTISQPWVGDLKVQVEHEGADSILLDQPGVPGVPPEGCGNPNIRAVFDDTANRPVEPVCDPDPALAGILTPESPLGAFDSQTLAGTWTLSVTDVYELDPDGNIEGWCLFARVADNDNDGLPDSIDDDDDNDTILDSADNCPLIVNPSQVDTDEDGAGNACDNCTESANGPQIPDSGGNSQRDTDNDGYGNVCDPDINNDCNVNFVDLLAYRVNFFQAGDFDTDNNGDNFTNFLDLSVIRAAFFGRPGPSDVSNVCD